MRSLVYFICLCLVFSPVDGFGGCVTDPLRVLSADIPAVVSKLELQSLNMHVRASIDKANDILTVELGDQSWDLKLSVLIEQYRALMELSGQRLPAVWAGDESGNAVLRAEYDYWVKKVFLASELSLRRNRFDRITYMLTHREYLHSVISIVLLPLLTWVGGQVTHFSVIKSWNDYEKTFLFTNGVSRTVGNLIRLDEIHSQTVRTGRLKLFALVVGLNIAFQAMATAITAQWGEAVWPRIDRAVLIGLVVVLYDIPISRWVHRFQFSNQVFHWMTGQNNVPTAQSLYRSQVISEYGIQIFLRVTGALVLQSLIHISNILYENVLSTMVE